MPPLKGSTKFASAERTGPGTVLRQSLLFGNGSPLPQFFDAVGEIILILNAQRQIVFCNRNTVELLGLRDRSEALGLRPGEVLGCVHAREHEGGCGTSEFCSTCGAVQAILSSQKSVPDQKECRILLQGHNAMDLMVRANPLVVDGETFTLFAVTDISHEKRRRALERVFFQDLMNTAGELCLQSELMQKADADQARGLAADIHHTVEMMLEEISAQRDLASAENHDLAVHPIAVTARAIVDQVARTYRRFAKTQKCHLVINVRSQDSPMVSDVRLLCRILGNMTKNAVEASSAGNAVTIAFRPDGADAVFHVHNPAFIPHDTQLQIFMRSFSTKGPGRGLGTYSMKLLAERYLKGTISFTSTPSDGTTFTLRCPLTLALSLSPE